MTKEESLLKHGTYLREPDGATLLKHRPVTGFNFPLTDLRSLPHEWRTVTNAEELAALREWLGGNLRPGEFTEVNSFETLDFAEGRR